MIAPNRDGLPCLRGFAILAYGAALSLLLLAGCLHPQTRLQSDDEAEREKDLEVKTVGDVTSVSNANPIPVSGVAVVIGLEGTGSPPPPGGYRTFLETELRKQGVENLKEIFASPNTSLVLVSAMIPAGAHKDDTFDVEVSLPPESKTTSLKGGYLTECILYNYDTSKHLSESMKNADPGRYGGNDNREQGDRLLKGHPLGMASGPLLVGVDGRNASARVGKTTRRKSTSAAKKANEGAKQAQDAEAEEDDKDDWEETKPSAESSSLRLGHIWGGGRCRIGRAYYLLLNNDFQRAALAQRVADRINETMQGPYRSPLSELAVAKSKQLIVLKVPSQYKLNQQRFLRVARLIPLQGTPSPRSPYRRRLEDDLLDPQRTVTSALRLEALGTGSIEALKRGTQSEHALVQFCSAEALAYLGSPACGEVLARMVQEQSSLRAFSLTALASLDEAICHVKLRELLSCSSSEARYGAFRALRALDEREAAVQGEHLNNSFWLHRVASESSPLVHLSRSRRAEIVLFGEDVFMTPPFSILANDFTLTAGVDDTRCTVCRLSVSRGTSRKQCSLRLEEVLRTLAEMGAMYPQVDEFLTQADHCRALSCKLAIDALPCATAVEVLAREGSSDPDYQQTEKDARKTRIDLGATPALYETSTGRRPKASLVRDEEELRERRPANEKRTAEQR